MDQASFPANNDRQDGFHQIPSSPATNIASIATPSTEEKKKEKILNNKNLLLVGGLIAVLAILIFGFDKARSFLSKASGGCVPVNIQETNLTSNSVEITFETSKACQAEIVYGTSNKAEALLLQIPEALPSLNHRIKLSPLLPATAYYYQIIAEGQKIDLIRSFLTKQNQEVIPTKVPVITPNVIITTVPTLPSGTYTYEEFKKHFYEDIPNPTFDINKDNIVNEIDWRLYQKATSTQ